MEECDYQSYNSVDGCTSRIKIRNALKLILENFEINR